MDDRAIILRQLALEDVQDAIDHYRDQAGERTAVDVVDALEHTFETIARHPAVGSMRWGVEMGLPGLRSLPVGGFPHLVFYVDRADHVDVWRILHGARDIPAWLRDPEVDGS